MKNLKLSTTVQGETIHLKLDGDLILMDALKLKPELASFAKSYNKLVIDMHNVSKVDLTGLNALLAAKVNSKQGSDGIVLDVKKGHPIFELLHLTKFTNQFLYNNA